MTLRDEIDEALQLLDEARPFVEAKSCHHGWCERGNPSPTGEAPHPACQHQRQWVRDVDALGERVHEIK